MPKFTICAAVSARVYADVEAESMDEAVRLAEDYLDWSDEEWVERPRPVSITDEQGHRREL